MREPIDSQHTWPWNSSTLPTFTSVKPFSRKSLRILRTCAWYGVMTPISACSAVTRCQYYFSHIAGVCANSRSGNRWSLSRALTYALTWIASSMLKYEGDDASRSFLPEIAWKTTGKRGVAS